MILSALDIGSRLTKRVDFKDDKIINTSLLDTAVFYKNINDFIKKNQDISLYMTGYGKNNLQFGNKELKTFTTPELKAHFIGAKQQTGLKDFILLDIGGQDTKVIKVENSRMVDFRTNEKCAAASGRYLENMSSILGIENIGKYFESPVKLSSTCAVFGESEVIGLLSNGISISEIAAGVNKSLFLRVSKLIIPLYSENTPIVFCGGLYSNIAIRSFLVDEFKCDLIIPDFPIHNGAIGAFWAKYIK
ncbi:MAG: 2-hydroxyglutaryl-CoA dehydratase [Candidatus Muiribacterium halophilum]|uniref:2-hydroxyglutaryl-CoA dehydratase n=1 Tax=Muiribacterium halophilum TaxID=2053465 RepID=A0A2N5ZI90_MUIH1|nr:MAG: 2-hydroxyglutaryl-CoA dehydratase [Candidatus Muirbacterium halophilum]